MNRFLETIKKIDFKDKRVYIPLIVIGIILVLLLLLGIANFVSKLSNSKEEKFSSTAKEVEFSDELVDDPTRKSFPVSVSSEHSNCVNDICVENVNVMCYEKRGIISFTVKNNSSSVSGGYLNLTVGNYSAVIWYNSIAPGKSYDGFHTYEGYEDVCDADSNDYYVREIDDDDKSSISTFKYYSCINNRNYYEIDFEGNRVFNNGDEDYKSSACIYRSKNDGKVTSVYHYFNPCKTYENNGENITIVSQCDYASNCVENSSGQCVSNGTGGDKESNNCVQYTVAESWEEELDEMEENEKGELVKKKIIKNETKTYCGKRDSNGYIVPDSSSHVTGRIKCDSYALCIDKDECYPFCEDLLTNK